MELVAEMDNEEMNLELLDLLAKSLMREKESRENWLEIYFLNIPASNNIIAYLISNWKEVFSYVKKNTGDTVKEEFLDILEKFQDTNEKLSKGEFRDKNEQIRSIKKLGLKLNDIEVVNSSCEELKKVILDHSTENEKGRSLSLIIVSITFILILASLTYYYTNYV